MTDKNLYQSLIKYVVTFIVVLAMIGSRAGRARAGDAVWKTRMPSLPAAGSKPKASPNVAVSGKAAVAPAVIFKSASYSPASPTIMTPTTTSPEAEEEITVDPRNPQHLLSAISDFSFFQNITKYAYSNDDGANWAEAFLPVNAGGFLVTGDNQDWSANSDPTVADDGNGNVYLSNLYIAIDGNTGQLLYLGLYVAHATRDAGGNINFDQSGILPVTPVDFSGANQPDKPWLGIDDASGNLYETWTNFTATSSAIMFAGSKNHGQSWSTAIRINPASQNGRVQGAQVAVAGNGTVYVTYELFCANFTRNASCPSTNNRRQQFLAKSTDGGASFKTPVAVTPIFNELTFPSIYRTNSFPAIAVGPTGTAYIVYSSQSSSSAPAQVEFIHSGASGAGSRNGFSAPVVVDADRVNDNFFPSIAADANGVVHMSWFDAQAANPEFYSVYANYATTNPALSFATPLQLTGTINSGTGFLFAPFIGDNRESRRQLMSA